MISTSTLHHLVRRRAAQLAVHAHLQAFDPRAATMIPVRAIEGHFNSQREFFQCTSK